MPIPSTIGNVSESNENITLGILSSTIIIGSTHNLNAYLTVAFFDLVGKEASPWPVTFQESFPRAY